jgi:hypothetical protein
VLPVLNKRQRLNEILARLRAASPFRDGSHARAEIERIMRAVEDEFSGVPENPSAADMPTTDGRMYPPDDRFEVDSSSPRVRLFKQKRHRTWFGENGAFRIISWEGTVEIDLPGADGRTIDSLMETAYELN